MDAQSAALIGAGLAAIGAGMAALGVGNVFGSFLESALRNPAAADSQQGRLFIGFAAAELLARGGGMLRLPPAEDVVPVLLAAVALGPTLVVVPSVDRARLDAGVAVDAELGVDVEVPVAGDVG